MIKYIYKLGLSCAKLSTAKASCYQLQGSYPLARASFSAWPELVELQFIIYKQWGWGGNSLS